MNTVDVVWDNWIDQCTLIIEQFGLPGGKYHTNLSHTTMQFHFKDDKDALMCRLLISEYL